MRRPAPARIPEARPTGRDVLRRLGSITGDTELPIPVQPSPHRAAPLVGRARDLESLEAAFADVGRGRTVALLHPWPFGHRQDRPGPALPRRPDRSRRGHRPGGPVLRAGVGALQGTRQRRRCSESIPEAPAALGGAGARARRHPIPGPGLPNAGGGRGGGDGVTARLSCPRPAGAAAPGLPRPS